MAMKRFLVVIFILFLANASGDNPWKVTELSSPAGLGSGQPNLVVSAGKFYLSWLEKTGKDHAFKVSGWDGKSWSSPKVIVTGKPFFVNWADFPSLLPIATNGFAAHWLEKIGKDIYAYAVMTSFSSDAGNHWSRAIKVHSDASESEHGFASMMNLGNQKLGYVWLDGRNFKKQAHSMENEMSLVFATFEHGAFRNETVLDSRVCDCCQTDAGVTTEGMIVAYRDRSDAEIRDISYVRFVNGKWTSPRTLNPDNWKIAACPVNGPAVAARGKDVAIAWFTGAGEQGRTQIVFSKDSGATFGNPIRIDQGKPLGRIDAVWLNDRDVVVSWLENTKNGTEIRIRKISSDGQLSAPFTVADSSSARSSGFPRMAAAQDRLLIAWTFAGDPSRVRVMYLQP